MLKRWGSRLLAAVGVLLVVVGVLSGVVNREVLDGDRFAQHVDEIRADPAVARQVGLVVSDQVLQQQPELVGLRPLLESASTAVVASPSLGPVVRTVVAPLHRALVSGGDDQVVLRLADVGALLVAAITTLDPRYQSAVPADLDVTLSAVGSRQVTADLISAAHTVRLLSWLLPLLGFICLIAAGALRGGGPRIWADLVRRALLWTAGGLGILTLVAGVIINRLDTNTVTGAVVAGVWHELDAAFWRQVILLVVLALIVAVVNRPGLRLDPRAAVDYVARWLSRDALTPRESGMRALALLAVGLVLVLEPIAVVVVVVGLVGVVTLLIALRDLGAVLLIATRAALPGLAARLRPSVIRIGVISTAVILVAVVVVIGAWPSSTTMPAASADPHDNTCNGHAELCDRAYDQVAFPATHNSMSAADGQGWFLAEQPTGVMGQLDDGVTVFLIDSWSGQQTAQPGIIANTQASRNDALDQARKEFGTGVVESALRLRGALNLEPRGTVKPYLCHALCELGSTEWTPLMRQVKTWMDAHPRHVLTFFVQDEVSPADTAAVFEEAGLLPYIHTQTAGKPWPTLGEMVDSGRRIVVLHEHRVDPTYPWILDSTTWVQDTPYAFRSTKDFSCASFRGEKDSPLFLVNHWLSNQQSRIADAAVVNAKPVLLARLKQCQSERRLVPNYVAVDNYDQGDLLASVEALNGVG